MTTGEKIRTLRMQRGITQEILAEKTGISSRSIQRIENNEVTARADSLHKIASALEVTFDDFSVSDNLTHDEHKWLVILHLSGLLLLVIPSLIIYGMKKDIFPEIRSQAVDVINFQLNLLMIMVPCGLFAVLFIPIPILVITATLGMVIIIVNTIRVGLNSDYSYPLIYRIIKEL